MNSTSSLPVLGSLLKFFEAQRAHPNYWILVPAALFALYVLYSLVKCLLDCCLAKSVKGWNIVIVGCDSGFGEEMTRKCVQEGANVYASVVNVASIGELQEKCASMNGKVYPFIMDISKADSVEAGYQYVFKALPTGQGINALINNAGIGRLGFDDWTTAEDYDFVWRVNALGHIRTIHAFRQLVKAVKGRIVVVTSVLGRVALAGFGPYCVSKFALEGYADIIRRELAPFGILVSIVEPGFHRTQLTRPESLTGMFDKSWAQTPEDVRKVYGEEFYKKQNVMIDKLMRSPLVSSPFTHIVVNAYYHAITSRFPKYRYPAGVDANLSYIPLSWMPAGFQDRYLAVLFKYVFGAPTPDEVKKCK